MTFKIRLFLINPKIFLKNHLKLSKSDRLKDLIMRNDIFINKHKINTATSLNNGLFYKFVRKAFLLDKIYFKTDTKEYARQYFFRVTNQKNFFSNELELEKEKNCTVLHNTKVYHLNL